MARTNTSVVRRAGGHVSWDGTVTFEVEAGTLICWPDSGQPHTYCWNLNGRLLPDRGPFGPSEHQQAAALVGDSAAWAAEAIAGKHSRWVA